YFQVARQIGHITCLERHGRSDLILHREAATHRVGGLVIKLNSAQSQTSGVDLGWIQGSAGKSSLQSRFPVRAHKSVVTPGVYEWALVARRIELEVELERIVLPQVRREPAIFE